jgi:hypothetical protein
MHCILEGLVQHHVRSLLGLTPKKSKSSTASASTSAFHYNFQKIDSETAAALSMSMKEIAQVSSIHALLVAQAPSDEDTTRIATYMEKLTDSLLHRNMRPLRFVCQSLHCVPIKNPRLLKGDYAMALVQWVSILSTSFTLLNLSHSANQTLSPVLVKFVVNSVLKKPCSTFVRLFVILQLRPG